MDLKIEFLHSDAQILLAISYSYKEENGASLENIIGTANFINRSYPLFEEVDGALARLLMGGFILENNGCFHLSPKTIDFYAENSKPGSYVNKDLERIEKYISARPWSPGIDPQKANETDKHITRELFEEAMQKLRVSTKVKRPARK